MKPTIYDGTPGTLPRDQGWYLVDRSPRERWAMFWHGDKGSIIVSGRYTKHALAPGDRWMPWPTPELLEADAAKVRALVEALQRIASEDKRAVQTLIHYDPAGSDYAVEEVPGRFAKIAIDALAAFGEPDQQQILDDIANGKTPTLYERIKAGEEKS